MLETTIAIGVIVTGLFAAFTLVIANRRTSDEAGLRFGAVAAAREGVEIVRSIRDSNWLSEGTRAWDDGIAGSAGSYSGVAAFSPSDASWQIIFGATTLDASSARIIRATTGEGESYWTQGLASDATVEPTPYRRLIDVYPICDRGEIVESGAACEPDASPPNPKIGIRVRSRVQWTSRGNTHEVVAEERMFNWR
ncbi:hypothetical protein HY635_01905 [Candidatus Uhrbacteria bacterium]|nr:hypothetical protein [Candidatus Uhrbacteria bacterium]